MFIVKNVRTGQVEELNSQQFKSKIIKETNCKYENAPVLPERTSLRLEALDLLLEQLKGVLIQRNVFLVTALSRINNNKYTRYMILIDGHECNEKIVDIVFDYIPIYSVIVKDEVKEEGKASELSHWFRNTMGRGFSFSDIDYLIINPNFNKVLLIEEKIGKSGISSLGYGQLISYKELITDVIKVPNLLLLIFSVENANLKSYLSYYTCNKYSFSCNRLLNTSTSNTTIYQLSNRIMNFIK